MSKWIHATILVNIFLATGCATVHLSEAERAKGLDPMQKRGGLFSGTRIERQQDEEVYEEEDDATESSSNPSQREDRQESGGGLLFGGGATPSFMMPVKGEISSPFGYRRGRLHKGIDLRAPKNTPIYAAAPGRVSFVGWIRGYGRTVKVKHGKYETLYAHSRKTNVKKGQEVTHQDVIGFVGKSGSASGYHLHFEYLDARGKPHDPMPFMSPDRYALNNAD